MSKAEEKRMQTNDLLHVLRNQHRFSWATKRQARLNAADIIEAHDALKALGKEMADFIRELKTVCDSCTEGESLRPEWWSKKAEVIVKKYQEQGK